MTAAALSWARFGRLLLLPLLALSLAQCGDDSPQGSTGSCASDSDCSGAMPACDTATGQCVGCVPGGTTCAAGSYCDAAQRVCLTGCAANADCSAGGAALVCDPATHACVGCVGDGDCGPGTVCKQGSCQSGCTDEHPCPNGSSCCDGQCFDTSSDLEHCGVGCAVCPEEASAHAPAVCLNGVCGFGDCDAGFADCNGDPADGCEADLQGQPGCVCLPGSQTDCYGGPAGTEGIGACHRGLKTCGADGMTWGPCEGEALPQPESCLTLIDDDCNGQINEGGEGCVCAPSATGDCYSGPAETEDVGICRGGTRTCAADGTAWGDCEGEVVPQPESCFTPEDDDCDSESLVCLASQDCNPTTGQCENPCDPAVLGRSSVGCEFYPTVTSSSLIADRSTFHFGVAIANSNAVSVNYSVTQGNTPVASGTVASGSAETVELPWIGELVSPDGATRLSTNAGGGGAYRLVTDRPVSVQQHNPLNDPSADPWTQDASLLLPATAWTGNYYVASYQNTNYVGPGFYAVTSSQDGTVVTLTPSSSGGAVAAGGGVAADGTGSITLNRGDVLQVLTTSSDLTGTLVTATNPVQVIGGHDCAMVPSGTTFCDHLEESMFPLETLSTQYLISSPLIAVGTPKPQVVRVIATQANTTLSYSPSQTNAPIALSAAGAFVELPLSAEAYLLTASAPVLVAQYMPGQTAGGSFGDPSMQLAVPAERYRTSHAFGAPTGFQRTFVSIFAVTGATVSVDGTPIPAASFTAIGSSGYSFANEPLVNPGFHTVDCSEPVGVSVYGYLYGSSYWYPAGLDLEHP